MKQRQGYYGKIDGFSAYATDSIPENMSVEKMITFFSPDEGKIFRKDEKLFSIVIFKEGVNIEEYEEINIPVQE